MAARKKTGATLTPVAEKTAPPAYELKLLNLESIRRDGGTQMREELDQDHINGIAEAYEQDVDIEPIEVVAEELPNGEVANWLVNGFHRTAAAKLAKKKALQARIYPGSLADAVLMAARANRDQDTKLRRNAGTKSRAIRAVLDQIDLFTEKYGANSNRAIADFIGCNEKQVRKVRDAWTEEKQRQKAEAERKNRASTSADQSALKKSSENGSIPDAETIIDDEPAPPAVEYRKGRDGRTTAIKPKTQSAPATTAAPPPPPVTAPPKVKIPPEIIPNKDEIIMCGRHIAYCGTDMRAPLVREHFPQPSKGKGKKINYAVDLCLTTLLLNDYDAEEYGWKCFSELLDYARVVAVLVQQGDSIIPVGQEMDVEILNRKGEVIHSAYNYGGFANLDNKMGWFGIFSRELLDQSDDFTQDVRGSANQFWRGLINVYSSPSANVLVLDGPTMTGFNPIVVAEETGRTCFVMNPNPLQLAEYRTGYVLGGFN